MDLSERLHLLAKVAIFIVGRRNLLKQDRGERISRWGDYILHVRGLTGLGPSRCCRCLPCLTPAGVWHVLMVIKPFRVGHRLCGIGTWISLILSLSYSAARRCTSAPPA